MHSAETIGATITPEHLRSVRGSVANGEYASIHEVRRAAVRLRQGQREEDAER